MLGFIIFLVAIVLIIIASMPREVIKSHWQHFFDGQNISSTEFYSLIRSGLSERKVRMSISETTRSQTHVLSDRRVYLRIQEKELIYYVCAAPFGTGTFVSWWQCETLEGTFNRIPVLSKLMGKDRRQKTFYQMDTEAMYKSVIHSTVLAAIEAIGNAHGMRALSELERQYK